MLKGDNKCITLNKLMNNIAEGVKIRSEISWYFMVFRFFLNLNKKSGLRHC